MTVKELIEELSKYPDDAEVVYEGFNEDITCYNFIDNSCMEEDNKVHLYEE